MTSVHGITTGTIEQDAILIEPHAPHKATFAAFTLVLDQHDPDKRAMRVSVALFGNVCHRELQNLIAGRRVTVSGRVQPKAVSGGDGRWYGELSIATGNVEFEN